ncbi:uncharacterized protein LOC125942624 isoform X1 [Dermacentor silvarum]|uniref:uncharacterized protein LOC125942624 isoform X1 n=1 Tax=Dermacentor silvarum TaxID=543639 RepID=UPI002100A888|nr:uncharacterized protein LOC125942624 isoform X1 [Dermacentor silvarum]
MNIFTLFKGTYDKAKRRAKKAECESAVDTTELSGTYDKAKRRAKKAECESAVDTTELSAMLLRVQLEVRQQNRDVLHELEQLRHEVRVVSERLHETASRQDPCSVSACLVDGASSSSSATCRQY